MTKQRDPLTFEKALTRVADRLGWVECARIIGRPERTIRNWSDPDTSAAISLDGALALDVAFQTAGGDGAPFRQTYEARLRIDAAAAQSSREKIVQSAAHAAKESGEAFASLFSATRPGASPVELAIAEREVEEARNALDDTLVNLRAGRGSDVGTGARLAPQPGGAD